MQGLLPTETCRYYPGQATLLHGGLSKLHSADDDAVAWLTSYGSEMHTTTTTTLAVGGVITAIIYCAYPQRMAELSWPGCLVKYQYGIPADGIYMYYGCEAFRGSVAIC